MRLFAKKPQILLACFLGVIFQLFSVEFDNPYNHAGGERITQFTVLGERCTGTNFVEHLVKQNINGLELTSRLGHKHFFRWIDLSEFSFPLNDDKSFLNDSDNCLGILIVRNVYDWVRSFYRKHCHADASLLELGFFEFMSEPWASNDYELARAIDSTNPYQGEPFKNVFELRKFKTMNHLAIGKVMKNFVVVRYEDLLEAPEQFIEYISQKFGLDVKLVFEPVVKYKGGKNKVFRKRKYRNFEKNEFEFLNNHVDWGFEKKIGYAPKKRSEVNSFFPF